MTEIRLTDALALFALSQPFTREQLEQKRDALLHTWTRAASPTDQQPQKIHAGLYESRRDDQASRASYAFSCFFLVRDERGAMSMRRKT